MQGEQMSQIALPRGRGVGRQSRSQSAGKTSARGRLELRLASGELREQTELFVVELRNRGCFVGSGARSARVGRRRRFVRPIPRDDRARHQIPQALATGMKGDQQQADEVGRRERVGEPQQIAGGRGAEAHGVARVHHDADACDPLARCLPATKPFEQDEVPVPHGEAEQHHDHRAHASNADAVAGQDRQHDQQREPGPHEDGHVQHGGQRAAPDARDLQIEHHVLRGLDLQVLAIVGWRRRQGGHAAIVISFRP
jgi:hypothetical protein